MLRSFSCALALVTALFVAAPAAAAPGDGIRNFLTQSADDWNHGNLDAFMRGYEDSPATVYIGAKKVYRGYAAIREHYASRYTKGHMGVLSFSDLSQRMLGTEYAVVVARWHVALRDGTHPSGIFSLVLHRSAGAWHIIDDHTP